MAPRADRTHGHAPAPAPIFTIGHSTRSGEEFVTLLEREGIGTVADVRAFPGSRRNPQFGSEALAASLARRGIDYLHLPELGGRRRTRADAEPSAWRNEGFRAYAAYMRTPEFARALDRLVGISRARPLAVMCAEAVHWRCHRILIADALTARGVPVRHVGDAGTTPHALTRFAVARDGEVIYPPAGGEQQQLDLSVRRPDGPPWTREVPRDPE